MAPPRIRRLPQKNKNMRIQLQASTTSRFSKNLSLITANVQAQPFDTTLTCPHVEFRYPSGWKAVMPPTHVRFSFQNGSHPKRRNTLSDRISCYYSLVNDAPFQPVVRRTKKSWLSTTPRKAWYLYFRIYLLSPSCSPSISLELHERTIYQPGWPHRLSNNIFTSFFSLWTLLTQNLTRMPPWDLPHPE